LSLPTAFIEPTLIACGMAAGVDGLGPGPESPDDATNSMLYFSTMVLTGM
jgi:hypothetical protein